ncbi:MAG: hypothetical protein ACYCTB_11710 [bacterium]
MSDKLSREEKIILVIYKIILVIYLAILFLGSFSLVYFFHILPGQLSVERKIAFMKKFEVKVQSDKELIKKNINIKKGKREYLLFKKYKYMEHYLYHHNKIAKQYLKQSAYFGYPNAEYRYALAINHLSSKSMVFNYYKTSSYWWGSNNHYTIKYRYKNLYAMTIAFVELAANQGYKPAMFPLAMLNLKGGFKIKYNGGFLGYIEFIANPFPINHKKAKKLLYALAEKGYKPAMYMVNKLYN